MRESNNTPAPAMTVLEVASKGSYVVVGYGKGCASTGDLKQVTVLVTEAIAHVVVISEWEAWFAIDPSVLSGDAFMNPATTDRHRARFLRDYVQNDPQIKNGAWLESVDEFNQMVSDALHSITRRLDRALLTREA